MNIYSICYCILRTSIQFMIYKIIVFRSQKLAFFFRKIQSWLHCNVIKDSRFQLFNHIYTTHTHTHIYEFLNIVGIKGANVIPNHSKIDNYI